LAKAGLRVLSLIRHLKVTAMKSKNQKFIAIAYIELTLNKAVFIAKTQKAPLSEMKAGLCC